MTNHFLQMLHKKKNIFWINDFLELKSNQLPIKAILLGTIACKIVIYQSKTTCIYLLQAK